MSNKRIYKKRQKLSTSPKSPSTLKPRYNENDWSQAELILDQLLECNTVCKNGFTLVKHKNEFEEIEWMINNLPTLPYVIDNYLNFMFTNKLTTGNEELDNNVLNPFLYKRNAKGVTNFPFLFIFISSAILICHSLAFCFLHSMHFPQPIGTMPTLVSDNGGTRPPFFLFALYFGFLTNRGYKHILLFSFHCSCFYYICN